MGTDWNYDRVSRLSTPDVKSLMENAKERNRETVVTICNDVLQGRNLVRKPKTRSVTKKVERSAEAKRLQKKYRNLLRKVADEIQLLCDLSRETAIRLSAGTKQFRAHRFTAKNGHAKTGGAHLSGVAVFVRYISWRLKDDVYGLWVLLEQGDEEKDVKFQVTGPKEILDHPTPAVDLREYLTNSPHTAIWKYGEGFTSFDAAAQKFKSMLLSGAPRKNFKQFS